MASNPFLPLGSKLQKLNPTSGVYENVPQVISLGFPGANQEYDDITNMDSPSGFRERVATVKAPADMAVELLWNLGIPMHAALFDDAASNPIPLRTWRVMFPNNTDGFQFQAFPSLPTGSLTAIGAARSTLTLGVTGNITRLHA